MACPQYATLHNGARMPLLGYGSWQATEEALEKALHAALEAGYRHIDTAFLYHNETVIGKVLKDWLTRGKIKREDLFIVTKLPFQGMRPQGVEKYLKKSLEDLQLDYVDMYLVHTSMGSQDGENYQVARKPEGGVVWDQTTDHIAIWKAMEAQVAAGRAKAIGLSNFNRRQIQRVLDNCHIKPANLQVELHVYMQQRPLVEFCHKNGIAVTSYSSLGSPASDKLINSLGDVKVEFPDLLNHPVVVEVAKKHNKSPAQVLLRHVVQRGIIAIPKSLTKERIVQNIQLFDFELSAGEMEKLNNLDRAGAGRIFDFKFLKGAVDHPEYPFNEYP